MNVVVSPLFTETLRANTHSIFSNIHSLLIETLVTYKCFGVVIHECCCQSTIYRNAKGQYSFHLLRTNKTSLVTENELYITKAMETEPANGSIQPPALVRSKLFLKSRRSNIVVHYSILLHFVTKYFGLVEEASTTPDCSSAREECRGGLLLFCHSRWVRGSTHLGLKEPLTHLFLTPVPKRFIEASLASGSHGQPIPTFNTIIHRLCLIL
jgi:hypothetical protein